MKVLVTGSMGMLARDLIPILSTHGHETLALSHKQLDITDADSVNETVVRLKPELIVNCAAYNKVDDAEKEEAEAFSINSNGVHNLCTACRMGSIALLHFSTDYVFDGSKPEPYKIDDEPNPINAYGRSKLAGERHIQQSLKNFYIVRTSWLFGLHGTNFVDTMLDLAKSKTNINVVNDQWGCPTWTVDLAQAAVDLIATERYGLYHIANTGCVTWYDFAREIFRLSGADIKIIPVKSKEYPRAAMRPQNGILNLDPLTSVLKRDMPSWQEALAEYLKIRG